MGRDNPPVITRSLDDSDEERAAGLTWTARFTRLRAPKMMSLRTLTSKDKGAVAMAAPLLVGVHSLGGYGGVTWGQHAVAG